MMRSYGYGSSNSIFGSKQNCVAAFGVDAAASFIDSQFDYQLALERIHVFYI